MSSSVFYRFKSSKEPSRVTFDGTGISVFDLKRDIIESSGLGNGLDFELVISSIDGGEDYADDTEIIPRSTTVVAKRLPAAKPGRGGAARYLSGHAPIHAKSHSKSQQPAPRSHDATKFSDGTLSAPAISELETEEQRMAAVLKLGEEQWKRQQKDMANTKPVHRNGLRRPAHVPSHPPPEGYVCHRCDKKGHWLPECPENGNPAFDDIRRVKKTMGIPRSQLRVIEKTSSLAHENADEDSRPPPGVMLDADGNWVIAEPDKIAWDRYQEKANRSAAAQEEAARGSKKLQELGLECPLDNRMFIEPMKTPCCRQTYCKECITNALLDDGLVCPNCGKEGVLIDDLQPDADMISKLRSYQEEAGPVVTVDFKGASEGEQSTREADSFLKRDSSGLKQESNLVSNEGIPVSHLMTTSTASNAPNSEGLSGSKKRKAAAQMQSSRQKSPAINHGKSEHFENSRQGGSQLSPNSASQDGNDLMENNQFSLSEFPMPQDAFFSMPMPIHPMMAMNNAWNPLMSTGPAMNQWSGMQGIYTPPGALPMPNGPLNSFAGPGFAIGQMGQGSNGDTRQAHFVPIRNNAEESAYFRQPVNPQRHFGRRNAPRPTDYREI